MSEINWLKEAESVISDIKTFVKKVDLSELQPNADYMVFINAETFENEKFCIKLCHSGFGVAGRSYDTNDLEISKWYETPYALLTDISKSYVERFKDSLVEKLKNLENGDK